MFTHGSQETCGVVGEYMCTVGSSENPSHKLAFPCDRQKAREFDKPYDLKEKIWNDTVPPAQQTETQRLAIKNWKVEVAKIYGYISDAEFHQALGQIKSGKAYHGKVPIIFLKFVVKDLIPLLRVVFHFWMGAGITTNGQAERLVKPITKPKKNVNLVGALRPVEYGHVLMKWYTVIITNRLKYYIFAMNIMTKDQFAAKMGSGSEDCLVDMITLIDEQHSDAFPTVVNTTDASDAYNAMHPLITQDKMRFHCGLDDKAMLVFRSLTYGVTCVCIMNGYKSRVLTPTNSLFGQGFYPADVIYCIQTNPLSKYVYDNFVVRNTNNEIIARIISKTLMDDFTLLPQLNYNHSHNDRNKINHQAQYKKSMEKKMTIDKFLNIQTNKKHEYIADRIGEQMQLAIDHTHLYLNTINIPVNFLKSHTIVIQDAHFLMLQKLYNEFRRYYRLIRYVNIDYQSPQHRNKRLFEFNSLNFEKKRLTRIIQRIINTKNTLKSYKKDKKCVEKLYEYAHNNNFWIVSDVSVTVMDGYECIVFDEKYKWIKKQFVDHLEGFRNRRYKINGKMKDLETKITILGFDLDSEWTFGPQIGKATRNMRLVRQKCNQILDQSNDSIGMGVIQYLIRSCSLIHLQYAGNIFLCRADTNNIRKEYNYSIKTMNRKIYTLSLLERLLFNGFNSFDAEVIYIKAKSFAKVLRNNYTNPLQIKGKQLINEIRKWTNEQSIVAMKYDSVKSSLPNKYDRSIMWEWFIAALEIELTDTQTCLSRTSQFVMRSAVRFTPSELPQAIKFHTYENQWVNEYFDTDRIVCALDGSTFYYGHAPKDKVFGASGSAIRVYFKNKVIKVFRIPVSTRTHINCAEMNAFLIIFTWLNEPEVIERYVSKAKGIDIVSDSQNCIDTIAQKTWPNDDVIIGLHKQVSKQLDVIKSIKLSKEFIEVYWVHSHQEEQKTVNDEVDPNAKEIAMYVKTWYHNEFTRNEESWYNPNNYIAYNSTKSESRKKANNIDAMDWNKFKKLKQNSFLAHYFALNIPWNPKMYAITIPHLDPLEQDIRMLLLTHHLPLNLFMNEKIGDKGYNPWCLQHAECDQRETPETVKHMLLHCPAERYMYHRHEIMDKLEDAYETYDNHPKTKHKVNFNRDETDDKILLNNVLGNMHISRDKI